MNPFDNDDHDLFDIRTRAPGPPGRLPLTDAMLRERPSGDLFGWTQDVAMGWEAARLGAHEYLMLSTLGGMREPDGRPLALGYHTGHWEIGLLVRAAAEAIREAGDIPFAAYCSDPCDGRTQGTTGMFDSLPYRNDAARVFGRLIRSLPNRRGLLGVATCDKGHPAMMMALAAARELPSVLVPGGVTLPPEQGEDAGAVQTLGARYSHGLLTLEEAADLGCRACATPGGGCQFLGTAATSQVVGEALGLSVPHSALAPSGQPIWAEAAVRSVAALRAHVREGRTVADILTPGALRNAMVVHAAFGGSTNLLLHIPAVAHAAGLQRPGVQEWIDVNRATPRLVSVLPNGPVHHPTVRVFLAGGVPEVMLHLAALDLLDLGALAATGQPLGDMLEDWRSSRRRQALRDALERTDGVDPDGVILSPAAAREQGLSGTIAFLRGNLAPDGAILKATALDPSLTGSGRFAHQGPARVFTSERDAMAAIKGRDGERIEPGDVIVLAGCGPSGTGMEETYQLTSALKHLPWGRKVALLTDARFSGVSTGACIGHVGPEGLAGGPIGRVRDGDVVRIDVDLTRLEGRVDLVLPENSDDVSAGERLLAERSPHPGLAPADRLPADTRLWAALQAASGGTWGGCVHDVDAILEQLGQAPAV